MDSPDVFEAMSARYNTLTKAARKVADYIFANRFQVQYLSITVLAEECAVAEATIFRFCQALGFSGYNNFKLALAKSGEGIRLEDDMSLYEKITQADTITDMARKLYTLNVSAIGETLNLIDEAAVHRAAQYLSRARRVYCFGQGGSMVMAMEAWARFITAAPQFQSIEDSHMQAMAAALTTQEDVILFLSYSGATRDMLDVLCPARARGAKIILLTHFSKSPGVSLADVVLLCGCNEGPLQSGSVAAKMALLFLIDVLFNEYCRQNEIESQENRDLTVQAITSKLL